MILLKSGELSRTLSPKSKYHCSDEKEIIAAINAWLGEEHDVSTESSAEAETKPWTEREAIELATSLIADAKAALDELSVELLQKGD
jgi:hypothetical protein